MSKRYNESMKERFDVTVSLGEIILVNGGELFRAHESMVRVAEYLGLDNFETYMLANGVFSSVCIGDLYYSCQIRYSPLRQIELARVEAANALSRDIVEGRYTLAEIRTKIEEIENLRASGDWLKILAASTSAGSFCYLFKGSLADSLAAFFAGFIMYFFSLKVLQRLQFPKMMVTIINGVVAGSCCVLFLYLGFGDNLNQMIIGAIFPLMPGIAFTNGVRNLLENDYLTGIIRLTNAAVVSLCIAIGVGLYLVSYA